jgi:hypothetical protein
MPKPGDIEPGPNGRRAQWNGERWVEIAPMPTAPATPGPRPGGSLIEQQIGTKTYNTRAGSNIADIDTGMTQGARDSAVQGSLASGRAKEIAEILQETATGPLAYAGYGAISPLTGAKHLTNLSTIKRLGGQGIFGDLDKLKGAISDRDVRFLREQQVDPNKFGGENQRIVNLMKWTGDRTKAYESAMNAWANRLGSPSATNARGQSFQGWWTDWSEKNMPRPDLSRPKPAQGKFKLISAEDVQ